MKVTLNWLKQGVDSNSLPNAHASQLALRTVTR